MNDTHSTVRRSLTTLLIVFLGGCSGGPSAIPLPSFDADEAAEQAMALYDTNGDGYVAGDELGNAAGLKAAIKNLDTDKDEKISPEEIAERVRVWDRSEIGMMMFDSIVLMDGRPLAGAQITLEPDEFLGEVLQAAVDVTDLGGNARVRIPKENRPTPDTPAGMQAGIYKVRVSKVVGGKETIPAKYNTETILGQEVSMDDWAIANRRVIFKLKSK